MIQDEVPECVILFAQLRLNEMKKHYSSLCHTDLTHACATHQKEFEDQKVLLASRIIELEKYLYVHNDDLLS